MGVRTTLAQFHACAADEDALRLVALVSDRYLEQMLLELGLPIDEFLVMLEAGLRTARPTALTISGLYQLGDGRVVASIPNASSTYLVFFAREEDRWVIDYIQNQFGSQMESPLVLLEDSD
jgi:hypothetical protein